MNKDHHAEEFDETEGKLILKKHWKKTCETLKRLMNQMNMMYYYEKIKLQVLDPHDNPENEPRIIHLEKLMNRCLKLY